MGPDQEHGKRQPRPGHSLKPHIAPSSLDEHIQREDGKDDVGQHVYKPPKVT